MGRFVDSRRIKLYKKLWISGGENHCFYCNDIIPRKRRSLDHLIPKSMGGTWDIENIVLCCWECNHAKADMTLAEFVDFVAENGGIIAVRDKFGHSSHSRKKHLHCNL